MTQMESPKRKLQKKNDYQRHKLFRKIKRRRKAQAEADQQIAMKQLKKKLKLPKFDEGEDPLATYKRQVEMFNDANSDPRLPCRYVDVHRITVNPETGDVMEPGGYVVLDPVIAYGKMPEKLRQDYKKQMEIERMQEISRKEALSPVDPIAEFIVECAICKPLELVGKAALYCIGKYGGKFGLKKLQSLARQRLLKKEFSLSNTDEWYLNDLAYSKAAYDHELIISPFKKQERLQLSQPTYQVYNGKTLSDEIKQGYFNYTKGQEIPLNFNGNQFRVTKNIPQVMSEGDAGFKNFPVGEYYSENIDDYYKNVMQPLFNKYGIDSEMRLPRGIITVPENNVGWKDTLIVIPVFHI